jgi:hypothetical protein
MSDRITQILIGFLIGVVVTIPAFTLAVYSSGAGHGDYSFARAFFPIPMLLTRLTGNRISYLSLTLAMLQLPAYGVVIGYARTAENGSQFRALATIVLQHATAAAICFAGFLPNFS